MFGMNRGRKNGEWRIATLIILAVFPVLLNAQWLEPNRLRCGVSGGFGGLHTWFKPSFDLHWSKSTFRVAPGLWYLSGGITQKIGWFKPRERMDRQIILSFYYHNDWALSNKRSNDYRKDAHVYQLMPGIHVNLDHRGMWFLQVSGGLQYTHERLMTWDREFFSARDYFSPMGEIRIGGIFISRKEHVQKFPHYYKKKPVKKIQKRKLKFKQ